MLHFCLIFFGNLLNKLIVLIVNTLVQGFLEKPGINGTIIHKKIQASKEACIRMLNKI
jgi:hypothetical protein